MADNNKLVLNLNSAEIMELGEKAKKLVFKPEFEDQLAKLLEFQNLINETVDMVKKEIQRSGDSLMPNFTGITGTKIKCTNRAFGSVYKIVDISKVDPSFVNAIEYTTKRNNPITETIDQYKELMGELPEGIEENARVKSCSISLIEEKSKAIK